EVARSVAPQSQAPHYRLRTYVPSVSVSQYLYQFHAPEDVDERSPCGLGRIPVAPGFTNEPPSDLVMDPDRMTARGRHHAAVSQELAADGLDQPATVAVAFPCHSIPVKLRVAVITTQRPAEILHDGRISVECGKVPAVGLLPDAKAQSFGFYVHAHRPT